MCEIHDAERVCICVVCVKCHIKCIFFVDDVKVGGNEMKKQKVNSNGDSVISRVANTHICPHCGAKLSRLTGKCTVCGWKLNLV